MRDHLQAVARATGRRPPELDPPRLPDALATLWHAYLQAATGKGGGGMGRAVLTWQDLAAWQQLTGQQLTGWESETLIKIDRAVGAILDED